MFKFNGGAARPSLFIFAAALLLLATAAQPMRVLYWAAIVLLVAAWAPWRSFPSGAVGCAVGAYGLWLLGNALFMSPIYSADSLYLPMILLTALGSSAVLDDAGRARLLRCGAALMSAVVLLGVLQYLFGLMHVNDILHRASGAFRTPNTFATALNLVLAPLITIYVVRGGKVILATSLWLFAGLVATESRGGMLALLAGMAVLAILLGTVRLRSGLPRAGVLIAGMAGTWLLVVAAARTAAAVMASTAVVASSAVIGSGAVTGSAATPVGHEGPSAATWLGRTTWDRADIFSASLRLIAEHPFLGSGAGMFFPLFETVKPDSLRGASYFYAHNDYLQIWLEFGLIGLLLMMVVVAFALRASWRWSRRAPADLTPLACGAALATCFAHSMVDFPLYVPFVLLVAGVYLGVLARAPGDELLSAKTRSSVAEYFTAITPVIRGGIAAMVLAWIAQPAIAELASNRSSTLLSRGEAREALYWMSVAQRFEPRQAGHYWEEAVVLRDQLEITRDRRIASAADVQFTKGERANAFDVNNLLGRVNLHQRYPELLDNAATQAELLEWARRAVKLRPQNALAQVEYVRALAMAGSRQEARAHAEVLVRKFPGSEAVLRLRQEL